MRENQTIFANFICKFGERNLLDYLTEIVLPAFTDDTLVREYGRSNMHFLDVEIVETADDVLVAGKFIFNTVLTRTHVYEREVGHVEHQAALDSSPSAFFVLSLATHRLVYFAETPHAPEIRTFVHTVQQFLDRKYEAYIRRLKASLEGNRRVSLKQLRVEIPTPDLSVIPLTGSTNIRAFVERYEKLTKFEIIVHRRNDEIDSASTMEGLDQMAERVSAPEARVIMSDAAGLDLEGVVETLEEVLPQGNQTAKLSGIDQQGHPLKGSNEEFSVKPVLDHVLPGTANRARDLHARFRNLALQGVVVAPEPDAGAKRDVQARLAGDARL